LFQKFSDGDTPGSPLKRGEGKGRKGEQEKKGGGCLMAVGGWTPLVPQFILFLYQLLCFVDFKN